MLIPAIRRTTRPPPDDPVWVAVKTVEDAAVIRRFRTQAVRMPVVENPEKSAPACV
jgi:hypothetical protein